MNVQGHKTYMDTDVIREAELYLEYKSISRVSFITGTPISTVGWHLKHRLRKITPKLWECTRELADKNNNNNKSKEEQL